MIQCCLVLQLNCLLGEPLFMPDYPVPLRRTFVSHQDTVRAK